MNSTGPHNTAQPHHHHLQQMLGQASNQGLRREQPTTMEELLERLNSVNNRLEGARNQLYTKLEKFRGEMPSKEVTRGPASPPAPCMVSGMLGTFEMRVRTAAETLDSIEGLLQDLNERI